MKCKENIPYNDDIDDNIINEKDIKNLHDEYLMSEILEQRLFSIDKSISNSMIISPLNIIQNRLTENIEELGLNYLLNYQTRKIGEIMNLVSFLDLYPNINKTEPFKESSGGIPLNKINKNSEISKLMEKRKSIRKFSGETTSFDTISNILLNTSNIRLDEETGFLHRNISSGGGLYPIDIYLYANNVENLDKNIYKFNPFHETLSIIDSDSHSKIKKIFPSDSIIDFKNMGGIFLFVFDYLKVYQKYGELSLSLGLIEVGLIAESIHLFANLYEIGTCDIGGFDKPFCESILKLDGINNHMVYAIVFGKK